MFVPVTTKPYLNSITFIILMQGVPAFFLIKKKPNQNFTSYDNGNLGYYDFRLVGLFLLRFELHIILSQRESPFSSGIIRLTLQTALRSFLASLIKIKGGFL